MSKIRSLMLMAMEKKRKNPYAVALGRHGGKKGGLARAFTMTTAERSERTRKAVLACWARAKNIQTSEDALTH